MHFKGTPRLYLVAVLRYCHGQFVIPPMLRYPGRPQLHGQEVYAYRSLEL